MSYQLGGARVPDTLYFNVAVANSDSTGAADSPDKYPLVEYKGNWMQDPFGGDLADYEFSVVRMVVDGPQKLLPVFMPRIQSGQGDANYTVYSVGVRYTWTATDGTTLTLSAARQVTWAPEDNTLVAPLLAGVHGSPSQPGYHAPMSPYYYAHSVSWVVHLINQAIELCYYDPATPPGTPASQWPAAKLTASLADQLQGLADAGTHATLIAFLAARGFKDPTTGRALLLPLAIPPRFECSKDGVLTIYGDASAFGDRVLHPRVPGVAGTFYETADLLSDVDLVMLMSGLTWITLTPAIGLLTHRCDLRFNLNNGLFTQPSISLANTPYYPWALARPPDITMCYLELEGQPTSSLWSPVDTVVVSSSMIPVVPEIMSTPQQLGTSNAAASSSSQPMGVSIITDMAVNRNTATDVTSMLEYIPAGEYRMASLVGSGRLAGISITLYWKDRLTGDLHPLQLPPGGSTSFKLMFRRKT